MRWLIAGMFVAGAACGEIDECEELPASFQLDFELRDPSIGPDVSFVTIVVRADETAWERRFVIQDELDDGASSIAITLTPPPTASFRLDVEVSALDIGTSTLAEGRLTTEASPDGCNRFTAILF